MWFSFSYWAIFILTPTKNKNNSQHTRDAFERCLDMYLDLPTQVENTLGVLEILLVNFQTRTETLDMFKHVFGHLTYIRQITQTRVRHLNNMFWNCVNNTDSNQTVKNTLPNNLLTITKNEMWLYIQNTFSECVPKSLHIARHVKHISGYIHRHFV